MSTAQPMANAAVFPPLPRAGKYQRFVSAAFLAVLVLMCTQYAVVKYGPAVVLVTPLGIHRAEDFGEKPNLQRSGLFVIDWATLDEAMWKLDDGMFLPPAEGLLAIVFLLALPLWPVLGRHWQVWPRFTAVAMVVLGGLSLLAAEHFKPGVKELAQLVLTVIVAWWVAGMAVTDKQQFERVSKWLGVLTVLLVLYGLFDYWRFIIRPGEGLELPTSVRATCASRTAFSGLMVMLLSLAGAKIVGTGRLGAMVGWGAVCVFGLIPILSAGALLAIAVAWTAILSSRGLFGFLIGAALSAGLLYGVSTVTPNHRALLLDSVGFYSEANGGPVGIQKRYLEMAAAINGLRETQAVTGDEPAEDGSLAVIGERSNMLFGVGPGLNYQRAIGAFYGNLDNPEKQEPDSYNLYLLLALQLGLAAALCWAWLLFDGAAFCRQGLTGLSDPDQRAFLLGVYGACLGLLVFSIYGTILVRGTALVLFTLLGVASRLTRLLTPLPEPKPKKVKPVAAPASEPVDELPTGPVPAVSTGPAADPLAALAALTAVESQTSPESAEPEPPAAESTPPTGPVDLDAPAPPAAAKPALDWAPTPPPAPEGEAEGGPTPEQPASAEDQAAAESDLQAWLKAEGLLDDDEDQQPEA